MVRKKPKNMNNLLVKRLDPSVLQFPLNTEQLDPCYLRSTSPIEFASDLEVKIESSSSESQYNFQSFATTNQDTVYIKEEDTSDGWSREVVLAWIFLTINFTLELPSAVFDQLSSTHKPIYALLAMLMSLAAMLLCLAELIYKGRKERVVWSWRTTLPWFYYPTQSRAPYGNFKDIIGLVCALCQCITNAISFGFLRLHQDNPIKVDVLAIIFAFGLVCCKIFENPRKRAVS